MSKTSVFGIVKSHSQAERVVEGLQARAFLHRKFPCSCRTARAKHDIGHVKATKAPEGATTGAATGGVTGGVLGLLAGIGALAIPGVGPFIAAGPIMAALSGAAIGAGTGGMVGGLVGMGIPEIEAKRYEDKLKRGNYLIAVPPPMATKRIAQKRSSRTPAQRIFRPHRCRKLRPRAELKLAVSKIATLRVERHGAFCFSEPACLCHNHRARARQFGQFQTQKVHNSARFQQTMHFFASHLTPRLLSIYGRNAQKREMAKMSSIPGPLRCRFHK